MTSSLDSTGKRLLGLLTGVGFGALLQHGRLSRSEVIKEQLLMQDRRVFQTMATAVAISALGVHALFGCGISRKSIKPMKVGGVLGGAVLFGSGLALTHYCPGTTVAAIAEGRRDAIPVALGMLAGAAAFVRLLPKLAPYLDAGGDLGKHTLPSFAHAALDRPSASRSDTFSADGDSLLNPA